MEADAGITYETVEPTPEKVKSDWSRLASFMSGMK